jgi:hypothetical protein
MDEKNHKQDFGLPIVDSTPMNLVNMEGDSSRVDFYPEIVLE